MLSREKQLAEQGKAREPKMLLPLGSPSQVAENNQLEASHRISRMPSKQGGMPFERGAGQTPVRLGSPSAKSLSAVPGDSCVQKSGLFFSEGSLPHGL